MPTYRVTFNTTDSRVTTLEKKLRETFPGEAFNVERTDNKSRTDRMNDAEGDVNAAVSTVQEILDETQDWRDNLPDNLQESEKADRLDDVIGDLQEIIDTLEGIEWTIEFPGATE